MKENKRCIIFHKKCYGIHGKIYTIIPQSEEKRRKIKVASYRFPLKNERKMLWNSWKDLYNYRHIGINLYLSFLTTEQSMIIINKTVYLWLCRMTALKSILLPGRD